MRTYALANRGRHRADGFDLCNLTHCQVLRKATPASEQAAAATAGRSADPRPPPPPPGTSGAATCRAPVPRSPGRDFATPRVRVKAEGAATFEMFTKPTQLQQRALDLLGVSLPV